MWEYLPHFTVFAGLQFLIIIFTIPWVLMIKKNPTSALAWCLAIILLPMVGFILFLLFGYNYVYRPLRRKRRHRARFRATHPTDSKKKDVPDREVEGTWEKLGRLAVKLGAFPVSHGNAMTLYHETEQAFEGMFEAVRHARRHIHLEFFIIQSDSTGKQLFDLLVQKAKEGVEVRLIYDAIGSLHLNRRMLKPLTKTGGKYTSFLSLNLLRRRFQINMRNHRKILVVDGAVGFTGGVNIGDEYLGKDPRFGYWRDEHLRLEGPAVTALQHVFAEDWDFAYGEDLRGDDYFPDVPAAGDAVVQIIESGPDQPISSFRDVVFAAISSARERLWIATPYFVPDSGILDALRFAALQGADVRLLCPDQPDHYLPYFAGRFYWSDLLAVGVKVYQYTKGMMHSKIIIADGKWATVGSANLDNRSLHLNFEVNCILHSAEEIADLETAFRKDLQDSIRVDAAAFAARPFTSRLVENACRLFSPVL